jgi:hypothetical protein
MHDRSPIFAELDRVGAVPDDAGTEALWSILS